MTAPVRSRQFRDDGLVGTLCAPAGSGPAPGVLLLGGSEGGAHERDARLLAAEGFTVERIAGPILLLSAEDDRNWPSAAYSQVAADRLAGHPHRVEHRVLPGAGHSIAGPPGAPFTTTLAPGPSVTFEMGGSPEVNTRARAECWKATTDFLTDTLIA